MEAWRKDVCMPVEQCYGCMVVVASSVTCHLQISWKIPLFPNLTPRTRRLVKA